MAQGISVFNRGISIKIQLSQKFPFKSTKAKNFTRITKVVLWVQEKLEISKSTTSKSN